MRGASLAFVVALGLGTGGCAGVRAMTAPSGDLADYRAFRVAAYEGTRLARAQHYLEAHPNGAFADEVRAAFEEEEPRFFERAQASREGVRRYLADLPNGPHARAAIVLLGALESDMQDAELRDIARRVHYEDAKLEERAVQRRAVGEAILTAVGVLLEDDVYGVPRSDAPQPLRALLAGTKSTTWGGVPQRREEDLFFVLPTRPERESRLLTLEISVEESDGVVRGGRIEGADMFVRWAEADRIVRLDPSAFEDRNEAQVHALDRLAGALERRFPVDSCRDLRRDKELVWRACDGWEVKVSPGEKAGDKDSIVIRGPGRRSPPR